jgi:hypothetical protein
MLPFYMAAIEHTKEGWSDWYFDELMRIIASHQDSESRVMVRALIEKLLKQPMNLNRRKEVISSAKKFGVADVRKLEDEYFDALLNDYFIRRRSSSSYDSDAVRISFEQPEYLPRLRDYYLTHTITFDVEDSFLDRVEQYSRWPGHDIMAAAVEQGRKRYDYRQGLLRKCGELRSSREQDSARAKNELITILQARLETDIQARFMNENSSGSCIDASRYWIYGDEAKTRARVALVLDAVANHKELSPVALDILNNKFSKNFQSIEEWKRWWTFDGTDDSCSKEMEVCRFWQNGCVSMGAPQGTSTCDMDCQAKVLAKLSAVDGIKVYSHARSAPSPLDCVGFREDLGGTQAGAKCLAKVLGYEYRAVGCNEDGFPYNVRVH